MHHQVAYNKVPSMEKGPVVIGSYTRLYLSARQRTVQVGMVF